MMHARPALRLALLLLLTATLSASALNCTRDITYIDHDGPIPDALFWNTLAEAYCDQARRGCPMTPPTHDVHLAATTNACTEHVLRRLPASLDERRAALRRGHVALDSDAARACFDAMATSCAHPGDARGGPCDRLFEGVAEEGE